jgi:hypothetical protein
MNICKLRNNKIYERTNIIPISPTNKKESVPATEYSLNENVFDPSKSSPPNEFLIKLQLRMNIYNSLIKDEIRKSE